MSSRRTRVAVLVSGRGSNMAALIKAAEAANYPAEIVKVISNRPDAGALKTAADAGIKTAVVDHKAFKSKSDFEAVIAAAIEASGADLICLAGFMRILSAAFVARYRGRILNIHPSLLPAFTGLNTHARALEAGVTIHGCTVHFVSAELDAGPILVQAAVPVRADDTAETLAARVLAEEHQIYPLALAAVSTGRIRLDGDRISRSDAPTVPAALIWPNPFAL